MRKYVKSLITIYSLGELTEARFANDVRSALQMQRENKFNFFELLNTANKAV